MKIVVVDDDQIVALSLKTILESEKEISVLDLGHSGKEAVSLYRKYQPDILLMDIRMEDMTGIEAASEILSQFPNAKILFLTTFSDDEYIVNALKVGAKGYILKQDFKGIVPALKAVFGGQSVFGGEIIGKLPNVLKQTTKVEFSQYDINEKELELMEYVAEGLSNREIADKMALSEGTIRNYLSIILEKLELRDRTQLAIFYLKHQ